MASKPQVTLTFAGDSGDLEKAFDDVGASAKDMESKVDDAGKGFDKASDRFDDIDTKAMGFRDTVTGVQDSVEGFGRVLKGDFSADALFTAGTGVGDLASGFVNLLVPSLKSAVGWLAKTKVGILAQAAASKVVSAATKVWTGIQAAFNFVMALNPVVLIIAAIVALVAVIVLIATKTQFFQKLWQFVWDKIDDPVMAVWNWLKNTLLPGIQVVWDGIVAGARMLWEGIKKYFGFWRTILSAVVGWFGDAWRGARRNLDRIISFVREIPGAIGRALRGVGNAISAPFRAGFNAVRRFWNNTIGGKGFSIPSWVPFGLGGRDFRFPFFHQGGIASGAMGKEFLAVLKAGERVTPATGRGGMVQAEDGSWVPRSFFAARPRPRPAPAPRPLGPDDIRLGNAAGLERVFLSWLEGVMRRNNLRIVRAAN